MALFARRGNVCIAVGRFLLLGCLVRKVPGPLHNWDDNRGAARCSMVLPHRLLTTHDLIMLAPMTPVDSCSTTRRRQLPSTWFACPPLQDERIEYCDQSTRYRRKSAVTRPLLPGSKALTVRPQHIFLICQSLSGLCSTKFPSLRTRW